jgi:drug/metabolite transporter (DMT)-like permease
MFLLHRTRIADLTAISLLGLWSFTTFPLLFTAALRYAPATHGALALPAATPILTLALATALGRERWTGHKLFGVVLAALVVVAALADALSLADLGAGDTRTLLVGDGLMLLAAATLAVFSVLSRPYLMRYGALRFLSLALGTGSFALLLLAIGRAQQVDAVWPEFDRSGWIAVGVLGIAAGLSNFLMSWALSKSTPTRFAVFLALNPIVAMAGGAIFLGEPLTPALTAGLALVIGGIVLVHRSR